MSKNQKNNVPYSVSQNFLTSRKTISRLIRIAGLRKKDTVLEIGAGKGHITKALADTCGSVISYEIDPKLYERLKDRLPDNVRLYRGDFLKCRLPMDPYYVFANIPFSVTTDIVRKLTAAGSSARGIWLVMEKGAAKRFCGIPKESMMSLLIRAQYDAKIVYHFRRDDFHPAPRVDTVLLELRRKEIPDVAAAQWDDYCTFLRHSLRYGLFGRNALLTKKQIDTALRLAALPKPEPSGEVLYIQWLCLFRCWLNFGKQRR